MVDYLRLAGAGAVTLGALTTASALYFHGRPSPVHSAVDFENQTTIIPGKDRARISKLCKNGQIEEYLFEDAKTLLEVFKRGSKLSNNGESLGWKPSANEPYKWLRYNEVLDRAADFGAGLIEKGEKPVNSTNIGIYSQNKPEYVIAEQACYIYSMVMVPLYDTLGPEACTYILNQADISTVICDKNVKAKTLLERIKETPNITRMIIMEEISGEIRDKAEAAGVEVIQYSEIEKLGRDSPKTHNPAKPDDICIVCYTSGTTGLPKGALLTHKGVVAIVSSCVKVIISAKMELGPGDVMISYLPLAHSYERLLENCIFITGAKMGFFQGDVRKLMDDIVELKPTLFPSVPRLLNRFYDKVMTGVNASSIKKLMFSVALSQKDKEINKRIIRNDSIWDKVVFKKVRDALGGRVRLITTGSAPMAPKVLSFVRCIVGCPVLEGYGQTECHAIGALQIVGDSDAGTVGPPLTCNYIKLADVPEMNYFSKDDKGEVCFKGPNVFKGYLKDPEKTKEAIDSEGWLHSGDVGQWLPNGSLKIIDRKKHIFKLAQGEYIAPEKIENCYVRSPLVAQLYIHGDSLQSCLVGIIVPDPEVLPNFAKEKFGISGTMQELCSNTEVKKAVLQDLTNLGKQAGLHSFEQVKDVHLFPELFSIENNLLTPTFKAKRQELKKFFASEITDMYGRLTG